MRRLAALLLAATGLASPSLAEPIGRWWAGFGQGTFEYGIKNDSAGGDQVYIACGPDETTASFEVGGARPQPRSQVIVTIGADEFDILTDGEGRMGTGSHVDSDTFGAMWGAIRNGQAMRVRLASGQSTAFSLANTSKVLPKAACRTDFER